MLETTEWKIRVAMAEDVRSIEELIPISVRALQTEHYTRPQIEAALGPVFGVDRQLIRDGTYFVAERTGRIIGCGGWSRRLAMFGGDRERAGNDAVLDPKRDAARIRAFFVHPEFARCGIGRSIVLACEAAIREAGFTTAELAATLTGEPLYHSCGFTVVERYEVALNGGIMLPVVKMAKRYEAR